MRHAILLLVLLLLGCQQIEPWAQEQPNYTGQDESMRPDITREYEPEPEQVDVQPTGSERPVLIDDPIPRLELKLPIGTPIGEQHKIITKHQLPLLAGIAIPYDNRIIEYDQELIFDFDENSTGEIRFGEDPVDTIGTFLFFTSGRPIFQYQVRLRGATWKQLSGRDIKLLGHTYVIAEATNNTVVLFGRDVDSNMLFEHEDKFVFQGSKQQDTVSFVYPDVLGFRVFVDGEDSGDIWLTQGESIADNIGKDTMASRFFDIRYGGLDTSELSRIRIDRTTHGYDLLIDTPDGALDIPLVEEKEGQIRLGREGKSLHIDECPGRTYCIAPDEYILLTTQGRSKLLYYSDVNLDPDRLIMRDPNNRYSFEFIGVPGENARTDIIIDDLSWAARIGEHDNATGSANISVRAGQHANRVYTRAGPYLEIHKIERNSTLPLELVIPRHMTLDRKEDRTWINLTFDGEWRIIMEGDFISIEDTDKLLGQTEYGVAFLLDQDKRNLERNEANEADILIPSSQALGTVRLEG